MGERHIAKVILRKERPECWRCGWAAEPMVLEIHHLDRNRHNNRRDNLTLLCPNCHAIDHFGERDGQFKANLGRL